MTSPLPHPADRERYERLMRERYGDPAELAAERFKPTPEPPSRRRGGPVLPTAEDHSQQHRRLREWVAAEHPTWEQDLFTLRDGQAHVLLRRSDVYGEALCGRNGPPKLAPSIAPPCAECSSYANPRRKGKR